MQFPGTLSTGVPWQITIKGSNKGVSVLITNARRALPRSNMETQDGRSSVAILFPVCRWTHAPAFCNLTIFPTAKGLTCTTVSHRGCRHCCRPFLSPDSCGEKMLPLGRRSFANNRSCRHTGTNSEMNRPKLVCPHR